MCNICEPKQKKKFCTQLTIKNNLIVFGCGNE